MMDKSKLRDAEITKHLERLLNNLKRWPDDELISIGEGRELETIQIGRKKYPYRAFITMSIPDNHRAIFVETWHQYGLGISNRYFRGFVITSPGSREEIPVQDLWKYD